MPKPEPLKTRPDLKEDDLWLAWLSQQPENRGIDVFGLFNNMLAWCDKRRLTPTRRRLLNWLDTERKAVPMTMSPITGGNAGRGERVSENDEPKCPTCNDAREITRKPDNPEFDWDLEFIPCPDCTPDAQART